MAVNQHLSLRLKGIQQALLAQHKGGEGMPNATIGNERETFLLEFLQKLFPAHRRFATGAITDAAGHLSGQIDVAVEYGFVPSFPMPGTEERLLLAESVALVIEVKSNLVSQWSEVRATTEKVKKLERYLNPIMTMGSGPTATIPCIAVGYTGHNTIEGLQERLNTTPETERPDGALIIESGCYCGFGITATEELGLYALCLSINKLFTQIGFASPDLKRYVR